MREVREALGALSNLQLIRIRDGKWVQCDEALSTAEDVKSLSPIEDREKRYPLPFYYVGTKVEGHSSAWYTNLL